MSELFVDFREDEIVVSEFGYPTYTFRLVDHIPLGYIIWNIGKHHMPEGYLPLCRLSLFQPFPGGRNIEVETLRAMKFDGAHIILDAIGSVWNSSSKSTTLQNLEVVSMPKSGA